MIYEYEYVLRASRLRNYTSCAILILSHRGMQYPYLNLVRIRRLRSLTAAFRC